MMHIIFYRGDAYRRNEQYNDALSSYLKGWELKTKAFMLNQKSLYNNGC